MSQPAYTTLEHAFARRAKLNSAMGKLAWDQRVMMPPGGAADRGEELATLSALAHETIAGQEVADALHALDGANLSDVEAANVREMRRLHAHAAAVPSDLIAAKETAVAACEMAWRDARLSGDFQGLLPIWRPVLNCTREIAAAKQEALGVRAYEALMDTFDPGRKLDQVTALFDDVEPFLRNALPRALENQNRTHDPVLPADHFSVEDQRRLARVLMEAVGYDFRYGRLDDTTHPFSVGSTGDARVTSRWDEKDFTSGLMAVLHETGHALYTLGGHPERYWQPVGGHRGMTIHESQSLFLEVQIGRSRAFTKFWGALAREAFGGEGIGWHAENLFGWVTRVRPGFIRVDADALTYPLHIILRSQLEQALIAGELDAGDVPDAWDEGMQDLLGIRPPDLTRGCLQDIHWYAGAFGYFPSYSLGAMAAAQLFEAAEQAMPALHDRLAQGDVAPVIEWLRIYVHEQGCLYTPDGLLEFATGRPLDTVAFKAHIQRRYLQ